MTDNPPPPVLPTGKLPVNELDRILNLLPSEDPRVLIGPRPGEDAALLDMGDTCLVVATDPVTFAIDRIGWYAVHVNANDVAVLGAKPRWFFVVLLLPEGTSTSQQAAAIMSDIGRTSAEIGVTVCGGHTEVTSGLARPIVIGQMLGEVPSGNVIRKEHLLVNDDVIVTHGSAIEGTAILAREMKGDLQGYVSSSLLARAESLLFDPGISVLRAVRAAMAAGDVHAMHDPTEGGLETGLVELVTAAGLGLEVFADRIPVLEETSRICQHFKLDPLHLIASGALLLATPPDTTAAVTAGLHAARIPSAVIGKVRPASFGVLLRDRGCYRPLTPTARDELARLLDRS